MTGNLIAELRRNGEVLRAELREVEGKLALVAQQMGKVNCQGGALLVHLEQRAGRLRSAIAATRKVRAALRRLEADREGAGRTQTFA